MDQTEPHFLSDPMSDRKKKVSPTLRNIHKKQHGIVINGKIHKNKRKRFFSSKARLKNISVCPNPTHHSEVWVGRKKKLGDFNFAL
jgi:hypothetical protein